MSQVFTAWDLIGFDGTTEVIDRNLGGNPHYAEPGYEPRRATVRRVGGRVLWEAVGNEGGARVRLSRLVMEEDGLRPVAEYVAPDAKLEVVLDEAAGPNYREWSFTGPEYIEWAERAQAAFRAAGFSRAIINASNLTRSPFLYLYVYLSDRGFAGPYAIVSQAAELEGESDALWIGLHKDQADFETDDVEADVDEVPDLDAAVRYVRERAAERSAA